MKQTSGYHMNETSDLDRAPPSFSNSDGKRIVFVDFKEARYDISFDVSAEVALTHSEIRFHSAVTWCAWIGLTFK